MEKGWGRSRCRTRGSRCEFFSYVAYIPCFLFNSSATYIVPSGLLNGAIPILILFIALCFQVFCCSNLHSLIRYTTLAVVLVSASLQWIYMHVVSLSHRSQLYYEHQYIFNLVAYNDDISHSYHTSWCLSLNYVSEVFKLPLVLCWT
jgi:hypothetical protein